MKATASNRSLFFNRQFFWLLGIVGFGIFAWLLKSRATQFLYFGRVPLLSLALFAGILPFLATNNLKSLLIGVYDLSGFRAGVVNGRHGFFGGMILGLVLVLCGMTIYTTATVAMELGPVRVNGRIVPLSFLAKWSLGLLVWLGIVVNAIVIQSASISMGYSSATRSALRGLVTGVAVAGIGWFGIECFVQYLHGNFVEIVKAHLWLSPVQGVANWLKTVPWHAQMRGYVALDSGTQGIELKHVGAAFSLLISGALYLFLHRSSLVPISYLLLLLVVLTWAFAALSFFLDFYRVPLSIPLILWLLFAALHPSADHYYRVTLSRPVTDRNVSSTLCPADVLRRAIKSNEPIILIAAAGGGIQSAAWTAQVLTGVEEHCLKDQTNNGDKYRFCQAIRLLSGISGGSVGSMYFAAAYQQGSIPPGLLDCVRNAAFSSSLSEAVKDFAYADLLRALAPFWVRNVYRDRGQGLERAWMINAGCSLRHKKKGGKSILCATLDRATLKKWQEDVAEGNRPAVVFNATTVESGQRLAFSTAPYKPETPLNPSAPSSVIDFSTEYPDADVLISTAVRLSSTFTYVSPAARPLPAHSLDESAKPSRETNVDLPPGDPERLHVVDGGYYENSGLGALVAWLNNGLDGLVDKDNKELPKQILIITIGAFPAEKNPRYGGRRGAIFQLEAPFLTLESMQGQAHPAGAWRELELLKQRLDSSGVKLITVDFTFPGAQPPLSWHLRDCDKDNIIKGWETLADREKNLLKIDQFLRRTSS